MEKGKKKGKKRQNKFQNHGFLLSSPEPKAQGELL